jgi:hypothetical protein
MSNRPRHEPVSTRTAPMTPIEVSDHLAANSKRLTRIDTRLTAVAHALGVNLQTMGDPKMTPTGLVITSKHTTIDAIIQAMTKHGYTSTHIIFDGQTIATITTR